MESKKPYLSKTILTNLLVAILAFFPGPAKFVAENPDVFIWGFTALNILLRLVTKGKIEIA